MMGQSRNHKRRKQASASQGSRPPAVTPPTEAITADTLYPKPRPYVASTIVEAYSGPIAHPSILSGYDAICPGSAEKIINLYEEQVKHRIAMENTVVSGDDRRANWGLIVGAAFAFSILAVASFLVYIGHDTAGIAFISIDFAGFGGVFVYSTKSRQKEREAKHSIKQGGKPGK